MCFEAVFQQEQGVGRVKMGGFWYLARLLLIFGEQTRFVLCRDLVGRDLVGRDVQDKQYIRFSRSWYKG